MDLIAYSLLVISILLGVAGQILLKLGMIKYPKFQLSQLMLLVKNPAVIGGFLCYGLSTLVYFKVLGSLGLSLAYPTVSLGYVLVILLSIKIFKEKVSLRRWVAVVIITVGVILVGVAG
jgi:multidrug transporter EmrE-like cation transporter